MAYTAPAAAAKSQPLHNFNLPHLSWHKDGGSSSANHHRRRSVKSPLQQRPNSSSSVSPLRQSPLRDSVSAPPPPHRERRESSVKQSPIRGESCKSKSVAVRDPSPPIGGESVRRRDLESEEDQRRSKSGLIEYSGSNSRILVKHSPIRGESCKSKSIAVRDPSPIGGDSVRRRDSELQEDRGRGSDGGVLIECSRSKSMILGFDGLRNLGVTPVSSFGRGNTEEFEMKSKAAAETDLTGIERSSKILIKIPCKSNNQEEENSAVKVEHDDQIQDGETDGLVQEQGKINTNNHSIDEEAKTWNLRPRKPLRKPMNTGGGSSKNNNVLASAIPEKSKAQSPLRNMNSKSGEIRGNGSGGGEKKKEKRKLTINISLTKQEIEEDIFSLTGSKPARRPKKRAKNIQKQMDFLFPGLWLVSVTPDSYKVSENSMKG